MVSTSAIIFRRDRARGKGKLRRRKAFAAIEDNQIDRSSSY